MFQYQLVIVGILLCIAEDETGSLLIGGMSKGPVRLGDGDVVPTGIVTANIIDETKEKPKDGHCPRCDALVRDEDRYCSHCGEKL